MSDQKPSGEDLNDLLDNALQDFDKSSNKDNSSDDKTTGQSQASGEGVDDSFFMEQTKILAERMSNIFGGPDQSSTDVPLGDQDPEQIIAGFKKLAEATALTLQGENPSNDEEVSKYSESIAQALKGLQEGTANLSAPASENDITDMFNSLNLGEAGDAEGNMFLPFMEGMMQSLLSAEILLPSIKELLEKYPKYLEDNADKISEEDKQRYQKQLDLYKVIEGQLESENPDDTVAIKREKFRAVLDEMRKLQDYGQPPPEILADAGGNLPFGDPLAAGAGVNPQCPTM